MDGLFPGLRAVLETRRGDPRETPTGRREGLLPCSGENPGGLTGAQWLEILPRGANKASAALRLKQLLNCSRLVCFGDAANDLPLFEAADECYAVENAGPAIKERATGVIRANDRDGVAKWLLAHADYA